MQARRARAAGAGYVPALLFPDAEVASGGSHDKVCSLPTSHNSGIYRYLIHSSRQGRPRNLHVFYSMASGAYNHPFLRALHAVLQ